jgi:hypothetical protein
MSKPSAALATFAISAAITLVASSSSAEPSRPVAALQQCRTLTDAAARLVCYDKAVDSLTASAASGETVIVDREQVRAARKGLFGFSMPKIPFLNTRTNNVQDASDDAQLESTIIAFRSVPYQKWRITIDGGAIWETIESDTRADDPVKGAKVLIEKGSLGSYYVKVGKGRRVAAKRVG